jgi:hypothetical protein
MYSCISSLAILVKKINKSHGSHVVVLHSESIIATGVAHFLVIYYRKSLQDPVLSGANVASTSKVRASATVTADYSKLEKTTLVWSLMT